MHRSRFRMSASGLASAALAAVSVAAVSTPAEAKRGNAGKKSTTAGAPVWAPVETAVVHPGVQMYTEGAQCTANLVFTDRAGNVYVGYAAHCAGTGAATDTNGCDADSLPLRTRVEFVEGGTLIGGTTVAEGTLVYSSWLAMQENAEAGESTCAYNDFALVKVDPEDADSVNPSIPFWGGPVGIESSGTTPGETVFSYGNSSLRGGIEALSPKQGTSLGTGGDGWTHSVYTATPGVPGDSGSAFLDAEGKAVGTLSTLAIAPLAGSNGVGDLSRELAYAQQHSGIAGLELAVGTEPFAPLL